MIKQYLEEAIRKIEVERDRQATVIKEKVTREQIIPFNNEIDKSRDEAISKLQSNLNANILAYQEAFAKQKQEIIDAAEKKKSSNANSVIEAEVAAALSHYNSHIEKLVAQLKEIKE